MLGRVAQDFNIKGMGFWNAVAIIAHFKHHDSNVQARAISARKMADTIVKDLDDQTISMIRILNRACKRRIDSSQSGGEVKE